MAEDKNTCDWIAAEAQIVASFNIVCQSSNGKILILTLTFENLYLLCLLEATKKREQKETSKIQKYKRDNT